MTGEEFAFKRGSLVPHIGKMAQPSMTLVCQTLASPSFSQSGQAHQRVRQAFKIKFSLGPVYATG